MGLFSGSWNKPPGWDELYNLIMGQTRGGAPDWMRQGFERTAGEAGARIREWGASELPPGVASGNILGAEIQARAKAMEGLPEAVGRYKTGLLSALQNMLQMQQYQPAGFESLLRGFGQGAGIGLADILI